MFKQLLLALAILLCSTSLFAQKIKIKKGEILVDKVPAFKFEKTSGKGEAYAYAMTTLEGEPMLVFSNKNMEYKQLPYEKSARVETKYCLLEAPALGGKTAALLPIGPAYGSRFGYDAKKTGFLVATGLDESKWEAYLDYSDTESIAKLAASVEAANAVRAENAAKSAKEYGEFATRGSGDVYRRDENILLAAVTIGKTLKPTFAELIDHPRKDLKFWITTEDGEHKIASIFWKKGSHTYRVRTHIDGKELEFTIHTSVTDATAESYLKGLNYLVNYGYM
jgi:hypothetical protein